MELIEVRDAAFGYGGRPVVRVAELHLHQGRCLGIFGPNGAGKTTLVRGVTGLLPPLEGRVTARPGARPGYAEPALRIGYLPQHRAMELHWPMTGFDAASLALSAHARLGRVDAPGRAKVRGAMARLDVEPLAHRPFSSLSGGQQQRLLLAGALAADPQVLVLDEPTDGLDVRSRQTLLDLLRRLTTEGLCTAIISHEVEDLLFLCDDIAWLHAADVPGDPSHVELIAPSGLADRIAHARRTA